MFKRFTLLITLLLCLTGCFDTSPRPEPGTVGKILGCHTQDADLFCVTQYSPKTPQIASTDEGVYACSIVDATHVYDGDTISNVRILVAALDLNSLKRLGEVFPNIVLEPTGIYVVNGLRIAGIDTPEIRTSKKKRDGTPRTEASRANEKKAAIAARDAVRTLITDNDYRFTIQNVDMDKYGRVLADVFVGQVNVAEYLILKGHAIRYDGGRKEELDWDALDRGLVF